MSDEVALRKALFESERDGVAILTSNGVVHELNAACARMFLIQPGDLPRPYLAVHDPSELVQRHVMSVVSKGEAGAFFETKLARSDGREFVAEISLSRTHWNQSTFVLLHARDITARREIEEQLKDYRLNLERQVELRTGELHQRTAQLNTIFEMSPDGLISFDSQYRVVSANAAAYRLLGIAEGVLLQLHEDELSKLINARGAPGVPFPGVASIRAMGSVDASSSGHRSQFELTPLPNRVLEATLCQSAYPGVSQILYLRDVTTEREVDRMKNEFLATAAHELRTPMASVYGFSELLLDRSLDEQSRLEMIQIVHVQARLVKSIVDELLDLARIDARRGKDFKREATSLQGLVNRCISMFQPPETRDSPRFEGHFEEDFLVDVDEQRIAQAMLNVLSNAYKYSPDGGTVEVSLLPGRSERQNFVGIAIKDYGIGMTQTQLARVCERFYRADFSGTIPGTGLGMSIVKEVVELHGGSIELESQFGAGTLVTLWLPVVQRAVS